MLTSKAKRLTISIENDVYQSLKYGWITRWALSPTWPIYWDCGGGPHAAAVCRQEGYIGAIAPMTTSSDELAEIRTILKQTAQQQQQNTVALSELRRSIAQTQLVTESNARSIAAMQSQIDESFALHERVVQMALEDQQQWREQRRHLIERYGKMSRTMLVRASRICSRTPALTGKQMKRSIRHFVKS